MNQYKRDLVESLFAPKEKGPRYVGPAPDPEEPGYEPVEEIPIFFPADVPLPRAGFALPLHDGREIDIHEILEIKWHRDGELITGVDVLIKGYMREGQHD